MGPNAGTNDVGLNAGSSDVGPTAGTKKVPECESTVSEYDSLCLLIVILL